MMRGFASRSTRGFLNNGVKGATAPLRVQGSALAFFGHSAIRYYEEISSLCLTVSVVNSNLSDYVFMASKKS